MIVYFFLSVAVQFLTYEFLWWSLPSACRTAPSTKFWLEAVSMLSAFLVLLLIYIATKGTLYE
jgi:hypothetical protein